MIKINQFVLNLQQIANGDTLLLTDIAPVKEFVDGKYTDKVIGFRYTCVCPQNKFEQISIRIEGVKPVITPEELSVKGTIKVKPKNFEGRFFRDRSGEYRLSAKAESLEVIN